MARLQTHHIDYQLDWKVELTRQMHTCIGTIQGTKATPEHYARLTNFLHAIVTEWNRMRIELDIKRDLRIVEPGKPRRIVRKKKKRLSKAETEHLMSRMQHNLRDLEIENQKLR